MELQKKTNTSYRKIFGILGLIFIFVISFTFVTATYWEEIKERIDLTVEYSPIVLAYNLGGLIADRIVIPTKEYLWGVITEPTRLLDPVARTINNLYDDIKDGIMFILYNVLAPVFFVIFFFMFVNFQIILIKIMRFILKIEIQVTIYGLTLIDSLFKGITQKQTKRKNQLATFENNSFASIVSSRLLFGLKHFYSIVADVDNTVNAVTNKAVEIGTKTSSVIKKL